MSKYTTQVRFICEKYAGKTESQDYRNFNDVTEKYLDANYNIDDIIDVAIPRIFEPDIVLFDPEYKNVLFHKILRHYYMREIGAETVALWKFYLNNTLKEILPLYNQRYASEKIKFDPMHDTDMSETKEGTGYGTVGVTGNTTGKSNSTATEGGSRNLTTTGGGNTTREVTGSEDNTNDDTKTTKGTDNTETSGTANGTTDETGHNENNGTSNLDNNGTITDNKSSLDLYADTPQGGIQGLLGDDAEDKPNSDNARYLTNARRITDTDNQSHKDITNGTTSNTGDFTSKTTVNNTQNGTNNRTVDSTETDKGTQNKAYEEHETINDTKNGTEKETTDGNRTTESTSSGTSKSDTTSHTTEQYVLHTAGKSGGASYSKMLKEFRDTFLNIDMEIIQELEPCFMQIW